MNRKASGPSPHVLRTLGRYLRHLREDRGWTLEEAAQQVGLSASSIGMAELGRRRPSAKALEVIAHVYRVDARSMLIKAGLLDEREAFVPVLLTDWAYGVMLSDPEFTDADLVGAFVRSFEVRAYVLHVYQRRTGKQLLREPHYQALRTWLGIDGFDDEEDSQARMVEEMRRIYERHPTMDWDEFYNAVHQVWHWSPPVWGEQPPVKQASSDDEEEFLVKGDAEDDSSSE